MELEVGTEFLMGVDLWVITEINDKGTIMAHPKNTQQKSSEVSRIAVENGIDLLVTG